MGHLLKQLMVSGIRSFDFPGLIKVSNPESRGEEHPFPNRMKAHLKETRLLFLGEEKQQAEQLIRTETDGRWTV